MNLRTSGSRVLIPLLLAALLPMAAHAADVVVDCSGATPGAFTTITAALATLSHTGPNSINVSGPTCTDNVFIRDFTSLTIFNGSSGTVTIKPANANRRLVNIFDSHDITIEGPFVFDGGRGIAVQENTTAAFDSITVQNSTLQGMIVLNSIVDISNSTLQNNTRSGISANGGTLSIDGGVSSINNGRIGVAMVTGHLLLNGGDGTPGTENVFKNNGSAGVAVEDSAEADIGGDNRIDNNKTTGLIAVHTSTVIMSGGEILNNLGIGIHVGETSHGEFDTVKVNGNGSAILANNLELGTGEAGGMEVVENSDAFIDGAMDISGNSLSGVFVDESSVLSSLGGNTINNNANDGVLVEDLAIAHFFGQDTITGNGKHSLQCDDTSLVEGDVSNLKNVKCSRITDRPHKAGKHLAK